MLQMAWSLSSVLHNTISHHLQKPIRIKYCFFRQKSLYLSDWIDFHLKSSILWVKLFMFKMQLLEFFFGQFSKLGDRC